MKKASTKRDSEIRKGPWSSEEDEVLFNFVNENGPRDWSSIQSKGLLPCTGKSCRLRWFNKLQPNLRGCKFSAEEEKVVVELQARFGNKWATISSYLQGRTDNDVKNFWSSRKRRLARSLSSSSQPSSKSLCPKQKSSQVPSNCEPSEFPPSINDSMVEVAHMLPSSSRSNLADHSSPRLSKIKTLISLSEPTTTQQGELALVSDSSSLSFIQQTNPALVSDSAWNTLLSSSSGTNTIPLFPDNHIKDFEQVFCETKNCCQLSFPCTNTHYHHQMPLSGDSIMVGSCSNINNPDGMFDDFPTDVFDCPHPLPTSFDAFDY